MRRAFAFIVLTLLVAGLACHGKPRRILRPAEVQIYDLPPADAAWTTQPPDYPKDEGLTSKSKEGNAPSTPKGISAGSAASPGVGGPGGANGLR